MPLVLLLSGRAHTVAPSLFCEADTIHFQPFGFHQLFGLPMTQVTDQAYDAQSIIGPIILEIEQKLAEAANFEARAGVAADYLLKRAGNHRPNAVAKMANRFLLERGALRIDAAAASVGLSMRQFERTFCEQVGVTPKLYSRIIRFHAALKAKLNMQEGDWTTVARGIPGSSRGKLLSNFRVD